MKELPASCRSFGGKRQLANTLGAPNPFIDSGELARHLNEIKQGSRARIQSPRTTSGGAPLELLDNSTSTYVEFDLWFHDFGCRHKLSRYWTLFSKLQRTGNTGTTLAAT